MLQGLLFLLPAVLLAIPLLARRYPGERVLLALRRGEHDGWPRPSSSVPARRRPLASAVRGGRLMGRSLAVRPPPAPLAAS